MLALILAVWLPMATADTVRSIHSDLPLSLRSRVDPVGATVRVWVDTNGRILECRPEHIIFGSYDDGQEICRASIRKKVKPARGPDNRPAYGEAMVTILVTPGPPSNLPEPKSAADVIVEIAAAPEGTVLPVRVNANVYVGVDGRVRSCASNKQEAPAFSEVACQQLRNLPLRVRQANGVPVPYVTSYTVEFIGSVAAEDNS